MKILLQKKFVFLVLLPAFIALSSSAVLAYDHLLEGYWESDEFQYEDLGACSIYLHLEGTTGSYLLGDFGDYFLDDVKYGDSSVSFNLEDSWGNREENVTVRYKIINDNTVEIEDFYEGKGVFRRYTRQPDPNYLGDTSLSSGCNSGGLWMVFGGLIFYVIGLKLKPLNESRIR
jgi:hypothetical protein